MQRYAAQLMLARHGDGAFSFAHNLLKTWLYQSTLLLSPLLHSYQPLQGARFLTIIFSAVTSFILPARFIQSPGALLPGC